MPNGVKAFLFSLVFTLLLLLVVFQAVIFNLNSYDFYYRSSGLYNEYPPEQLLGQVENVLKYLTGQQALNQEPYTQKEILHLADIKILILAIQILTLVLAALSILGRRIIFQAKALFWSALGLGMTGLIIWFFFEPIFNLFHVIVFPNDFWILDPKIHLLIVLYPPEFFFKVLISAFSVTLMIILIIVFYMGWRTKHKKNVIISNN